MAEFTAKGANILVVDDDDDIREIVHILLAREGFTVREAANAEQALRRLDPLPDLVILDVMMPGLSGIELCREIRTKAMMPILFLSAKTRDVDKAEGLANGGDDYLIKPFSALELTSRVKALLRRSMVYQPPNGGSTAPDRAKRRVVHRPHHRRGGAGGQPADTDRNRSPAFAAAGTASRRCTLCAGNLRGSLERELFALGQQYGHGTHQKSAQKAGNRFDPA